MYRRCNPLLELKNSDGIDCIAATFPFDPGVLAAVLAKSSTYANS